jgi:hypothetical protein
MIWWVIHQWLETASAHWPWKLAEEFHTTLSLLATWSTNQPWVTWNCHVPVSQYGGLVGNFKLGQCFSVRVFLPIRGRLVIVCRHFWSLQVRGWTWFLMSRDHRCCLTSHTAQNNFPITRNYAAQNINSTKAIKTLMYLKYILKIEAGWPS